MSVSGGDGHDASGTDVENTDSEAPGRPLRRSGPMREGSSGVIAFPGRTGQSPRCFPRAAPPGPRGPEADSSLARRVPPPGPVLCAVDGGEVAAGDVDGAGEEEDPGAFWDSNPVAALLLERIGTAFEDFAGIDEVFFDIDDVSCLPAVLFDVCDEIPEPSMVRALAATLAEASRRDVIWLGSSVCAVDFVLAADPDDPAFDRTRFVDEETEKLPPPLATAAGATIIELRPRLAGVDPGGAPALVARPPGGECGDG